MGGWGHTCQDVITVGKQGISQPDRQIQRDCWRADDGRSVPLVCTRQLKISLNHAHAGRPAPPRLGLFSLRVQFLKHSSCSRVKSPKFFRCLSVCNPPCGLILTHAHTDCTNMLPPVPTPATATCPSQSVAADNTFTQSHTHTNVPNGGSSRDHLSKPSDPLRGRATKADTHPHSCLPAARTPEGRGWSQWV